jgi:hypothetical protein
VGWGDNRRAWVRLAEAAAASLQQRDCEDGAGDEGLKRSGRAACVWERIEAQKRRAGGGGEAGGITGRQTYHLVRRSRSRLFLILLGALWRMRMRHCYYDCLQVVGWTKRPGRRAERTRMQRRCSSAARAISCARRRRRWGTGGEQLQQVAGPNCRART